VKDICKANLSFLVPYFIFLCCGAVLIAINTKGATHLEFNSLHAAFFDIFFTYLTYLGDGVTALLVVIILLTVKFRYALFVGLANILSTLITQVLKHTFFSDVVRPKKFFEGAHDLYLVSGVHNHLYHSFPSGHSTCAFSLYFALAVLVKNKILKFALFLIALLVGYSRIYLSQHFLEDVVAGSLIGVIITAITFLYIKDNNSLSLNGSLITVFKKQ
jgi:membrane-associated phospholipid phosphatase